MKKYLWLAFPLMFDFVSGAAVNPQVAIQNSSSVIAQNAAMMTLSLNEREIVRVWNLIKGKNLQVRWLDSNIKDAIAKCLGDNLSGATLIQANVNTFQDKARSINDRIEASRAQYSTQLDGAISAAQRAHISEDMIATLLTQILNNAHAQGQDAVNLFQDTINNIAAGGNASANPLVNQLTNQAQFTPVSPANDLDQKLDMIKEKYDDALIDTIQGRLNTNSWHLVDVKGFTLIIAPLSESSGAAPDFSDLGVKTFTADMEARDFDSTQDLHYAIFSEAVREALNAKTKLVTGDERDLFSRVTNQNEKMESYVKRTDRRDITLVGANDLHSVLNPDRSLMQKFDSNEGLFNELAMHRGIDGLGNIKNFGHLQLDQQDKDFLLEEHCKLFNDAAAACMLSQNSRAIKQFLAQQLKLLFDQLETISNDNATVSRLVANENQAVQTYVNDVTRRYGEVKSAADNLLLHLGVAALSNSPNDTRVLELVGNQNYVNDVQREYGNVIGRLGQNATKAAIDGELQRLIDIDIADTKDKIKILYEFLLNDLSGNPNRIAAQKIGLLLKRNLSTISQLLILCSRIMETVFIDRFMHIKRIEPQNLILPEPPLEESLFRELMELLDSSRNMLLNKSGILKLEGSFYYFTRTVNGSPVRERVFGGEVFAKFASSLAKLLGAVSRGESDQQIQDKLKVFDDVVQYISRLQIPERADTAPESDSFVSAIRGGIVKKIKPIDKFCRTIVSYLRERGNSTVAQNWPSSVQFVSQASVGMPLFRKELSESKKKIDDSWNSFLCGLCRPDPKNFQGMQNPHRTWSIAEKAEFLVDVNRGVVQNNKLGMRLDAGQSGFMRVPAICLQGRVSGNNNNNNNNNSNEKFLLGYEDSLTHDSVLPDDLKQRIDDALFSPAGRRQFVDGFNQSIDELIGEIKLASEPFTEPFAVGERLGIIPPSDKKAKDKPVWILLNNKITRIPNHLLVLELLRDIVSSDKVKDGICSGEIKRLFSKNDPEVNDLKDRLYEYKGSITAVKDHLLAQLNTLARYRNSPREMKNLIMFNFATSLADALEGIETELEAFNPNPGAAQQGQAPRNPGAAQQGRAQPRRLNLTQVANRISMSLNSKSGEAAGIASMNNVPEGNRESVLRIIMEKGKQGIQAVKKIYNHADINQAIKDIIQRNGWDQAPEED